MQWRMGSFRLDQDHACLWRGEERVVLRPKTFDLLVYLVEHAGDLVSKEELLDAIWPETAVADSTLSVSVSELRKVLGETARAPQFITTVYRRGYRFIAPVTPIAPPAPTVSSMALEPPYEAVPDIPISREAERRQLTVLFCDLVDSTRLAGQLDPEDWREVLQAYHQTCADVVARFDGYVAQYLGDGVLVYFGYPVAHEDNAQRAVWSGLGLLAALEALNTRLALPPGYDLAVRLGVHTGLVVMSEVGVGARHDPLAQGETPPIAARLQSLAGANELVISAATRELLGRVFNVKDLGEQVLRGVATPMRVYRVEGARTVASRFEAMNTSGLTPLVGRDEELELLWRRWQQASEGESQVVLLSGEAGLGKSRLVQTLCERLADEPHQRLLYQCSPYHLNSAFYPVIAHLEHTLQLEPVSAPAAKLDRLETWLSHAAMAVAEVVPLLASLLSIPSGERYGPLTLSPEQQKEQTLAAWAELVVALSQRQPVLVIFEDVHWSDPSTLEALAYMIDRMQESRVLLVLTCRPVFVPSWGRYAHVTTYTLNRLTRRQVVAMVERIAGRTHLPAALVEQIVTKTDGVPLFVEELTKMVLESTGSKSDEGAGTLVGTSQPLALPTTLQDALMARLDRLPSAREIAQVGAVLGREFTYDMLRAIVPVDDEALQAGLAQLVQAELLHQRGHPPRSHYLFKHALVQETAYQSLLKRTRQQVHHRIARVLEAQLPRMSPLPLELLAQHYTKAGLPAQAIPYWQQAGEHAVERSANIEAIADFNQALALLEALPEGEERKRHELALCIPLGASLVALKGYGPEGEYVYTRAWTLCQQIGDPMQHFQILRGLSGFYFLRADLPAALAMRQSLLQIAQQEQKPFMLLSAHESLGSVYAKRGELHRALEHFTQGITYYETQSAHFRTLLTRQNRAVMCLSYTATTLWYLGYPDQSLRKSHEALTLAQNLAHPLTLVHTHENAAILYYARREVQKVHDHAEATIRLATEQGMAVFNAAGTMLRGWALTMRGQPEGIDEIRRGLDAYRATGGILLLPTFFSLLADAYGQMGESEQGLTVLTQALALVDQTGERLYEAELHRLKGKLLLRATSDGHDAAEDHFHQAMAVARNQSATSWELRATLSLARLWQQQGKQMDALALLAPVYDGFTEGFDTADLREARAMLGDLPDGSVSR